MRRPDETGSFDPALGAFIPTKFLGSRDGTNCIRNFDQLSLIQGISSSLFNVLNTSVRPPPPLPNPHPEPPGAAR